jgi:pilus assembly protein Flp/PilA
MLNKLISIKSQKGVTMIEHALTAAKNKFLSINSIKSQKGVTMIEYALIASLVAVAAITALTGLGGSLDTMFAGVAEKIVAP